MGNERPGAGPRARRRRCCRRAQIGNRIAIQLASRSHSRMPERVWNRAEPPSTWAVASVAWPHRSTSVIGVNHRSSKALSGRATANAVSEWFISRATCCMTSSDGKAASTATAAGFPLNGSLVKASTIVSCTASSQRTGGSVRVGFSFVPAAVVEAAGAAPVGLDGQSALAVFGDGRTLCIRIPGASSSGVETTPAEESRE